MPNIRLGFRNIFDPAMGCRLSASPALVATMPEANLQTQARYKVARSTSLASQDIKASWAIAQRFNYVFSRMHNYTAAAQTRDRTYTDSAYSTGLVDNALANCYAYTNHARNDVLTEFDFRLLKNSVRYISPLVTTLLSYIMTISDPANPDGWLEFSRLFGGEYYECEYQLPGGGVLFTFDDYGTQSRAHDGSIISDKGAKGRKLELSSDCFSSTDWNELLAGQRYCGFDKDLFVSVTPTNGTFLEPYYHGLFKFQQLSALDRKLSTQASSKLILVES